MITLHTNNKQYNVLEELDNLKQVTYNELVDLRNTGKLIPGCWYRITDYQCTTTQEDTQSAGHQFDIILLALSENKLAEEGWAMMHPTDIYDMTFADGVRKVYILKNNDNECNIVDVETLLGFKNYIYHTDNGDPEVEVNWENHTATDLLGDTFEQALTEENVPYNYFQNSNLSAWKIWYCLDNDTDRFAWADDSVDESGPAKINDGWIRSVENDAGEKYAWDSSTSPMLHNVVYTDKEIPEVGDVIYRLLRDFTEFGTVSSYTPAHEGTGLPNGRGVIYRLIDEWNNDCPYDFKNILFLRNLDGTVLDPSKDGVYVPAFCLYDENTTEYKDASIFAINYADDVGAYKACHSNYISEITDSDIMDDSSPIWMLPNNVIIKLVADNAVSWDSNYNKLYACNNNHFNNVYYSTFKNVIQCNFTDIEGSTVFGVGEETFNDLGCAIICGQMQVVWEDRSNP